MKRLFAAIVALCLLALPACGDAPVETTPAVTTPTPTTPAPTTPAVTTPICTTPAPTTPAPTTPVVTTPVVTPPPEPPPEMPEITPLTDAQIEEINAAWLAKKGYPAKWFDENEIVTRHFGLRYYGTCNGYQILFAPETKVFTTRISFGEELTVSYPTEFSLYAYREGTFYSASALFADGMLSTESLTDVVNCHRATEYALANRPDLDNPYDCISPDFPALELLPQEMRDQIEADYRAIHEYDLSGVIYCGTYNGCVVFVFDVATDAWNPHNIGGQYFELGSCMGFIIYKDGEFLPSRMEYSALLYAFNHNYLTASDIEKIEHYARTQMEALGLDAPFASSDLPQ